MKHYAILLLLFIIGLRSSAQNHTDCDSALVICEKQTLVLPIDKGAGNDILEMNDAPCFLIAPGNIESNSVWIRWQVEQSGTLWFIIRPFDTLNDIDFVVYRLPAGNCPEKVSVRCMAVGDMNPNGPCMGPTGLLLWPTDINGPPGCPTGMDNFLRAIEMLAGEHYVLAINNFTSNSDTISIEFCGTALLGCETEICTVLDAAYPNSQRGLSIGNIVPNPISAEGSASIEIIADQPQLVLVRLFDFRGQLIREDFQMLSAGLQNLKLQTQNLSAGVYFVSILSEKTLHTKRLVVGQ